MVMILIGTTGTVPQMVIIQIVGFGTIMNAGTGNKHNIVIFVINFFILSRLWS